MEKRRECLVIPRETQLDFLKLHTYIHTLLCREENYLHRPIVIFCVGSDCYLGDALGPLVGEALQSLPGISVYGNLEYPVHAGILCEEISKLNRIYPNPIVIAVDACLGESGEIGNIEVWQGGLRAGLAMGKDIPEFGDITIIGIVNANTCDTIESLKNASLKTVIRLSKSISQALNLLIYQRDGNYKKTHGMCTVN